MTATTAQAGQAPGLFTKMTPLFQMGRLCATPAAMEALKESGQFFEAFVSRHVAGDWLHMNAEDIARNMEALRTGGRIFSSFALADGTRLYVITEADRSVTTLLLPSDY